MSCLLVVAVSSKLTWSSPNVQFRVVFIAGDISPIDVITHLPVLCEDHNIPYVYVPSKEDLGSAGSTKRPTSVIMVTFKKDADYADTYKEVLEEVKEMNSKM